MNKHEIFINIVPYYFLLHVRYPPGGEDLLTKLETIV